MHKTKNEGFIMKIQINNYLKGLFGSAKEDEHCGSGKSAERLNPKIFDIVDNATIEYCKEEGNRQIDGLVQVGNSIKNKCLSFIGIIATALIALIGTLILLISQGNTNGALFFFDLYGIMSLGTVGVKLIKGAIYERSLKISGDKPTNILSDITLDYAKKQMEKRKDKSSYNYIVAQQLNRITEKINYDRTENERLQKCFKSCIKQLCVFFAIAIPLLLFFWIIS